MAYTNFTHCTVDEYTEIIYSQDDRNKARIWFNGTELEDFGYKCEKITKTTRIMPNDGKKVLTLSNYVATELEVILHDVDIEDLVDQVEISIGTLVDEQNDTYEYVPFGIFNIQDTPIMNNDKITLKLRDNRVKFDFNYNAKPLIDLHGGSATKRQILDDICTQAGVICDVSEFEFEDDEIGIYDDSIKAQMYVSFLAEQCGRIPITTREGHLDFLDLMNLYTWRIPKSILPKPYTLGTPFEIQRVVYEQGIIKYESSNDETLETLYINSSNPYIDRQEQITYIYNLLNGFTIDSVTTQKMLGNPAIDPYDLVEVYDDSDPEEPILFKTFANQIYTFNGKHGQQFDTQIGKEQRKENVSIKGQSSFERWARTEINNLDATVRIQAGEIGDRTHKETSITQDIDSIESQIIDMPTIATENEGQGLLLLQDLLATKLISLKVHPTNQDIIGLFASPEIKARNGLTALSRGVTFFGNITYYYEIPRNLYHLNDTFDEFIYDGLNERMYIIHRIEIDELGNKSILTTPYEEELEYKDFIIGNGNYNIYMESYPTAYIYIKAMIQNDYTQSFATSYELNSKITQTANEINLQVSQKVDENEIISAINLTSEEAKIKAKRLSLEGLTTINDGFIIDESGNMSCNNATINGNLVTANGVLTNLIFPCEIWGWTFDNVYDMQGGWFVGFNINAMSGSVVKSYINFTARIPENFTVTSAKIYLRHSPMAWTQSGTITYGSCKNMRAYLTTGLGARGSGSYNGGAMIGGNEPTFTLINQVSSHNFSDSIFQEWTTEDFKDIFTTSGTYNISYMTTTAKPTDVTIPNANTKLGPHTGILNGYLEIVGYMKYETQNRNILLSNIEENEEQPEEEIVEEVER